MDGIGVTSKEYKNLQINDREVINQDEVGGQGRSYFQESECLDNQRSFRLNYALNYPYEIDNIEIRIQLKNGQRIEDESLAIHDFKLYAYLCHPSCLTCYGYYLNQELMACEKCNVYNCKICQTSEICNECDDGYYTTCDEKKYALGHNLGYRIDCTNWCTFQKSFQVDNQHKFLRIFFQIIKGDQWPDPNADFSFLVDGETTSVKIQQLGPIQSDQNCGLRDKADHVFFYNATINHTKNEALIQFKWKQYDISNGMFLGIRDVLVFASGCLNECKNCQNEYQCTECYGDKDQEYSRIVDNFCKCPDGYYDDLVNENCQECNFPCQTCDKADNCLQCVKSLPARIVDQMCACENGYYDDGENIQCQMCDYQCKKCENSGSCQECLNPQFQIPNCEVDQIGYQQQKIDLYTVKDRQCPKKCASCRYKDICQNCVQGENREQITLNCICKEGFHDFSQTTKDCYKCPKYCKKCEDYNYCTQCEQGLGLVLNYYKMKCECQQNFKWDEVKGKCRKCYVFLNHKDCYFQCPSFTLQDEDTRQCIQVHYYQREQIASLQDILIVSLLLIGVILTIFAIKIKKIIKKIEKIQQKGGEILVLQDQTFRKQMMELEDIFPGIKMFMDQQRQNGLLSIQNQQGNQLNLQMELKQRQQHQNQDLKFKQMVCLNEDIKIKVPKNQENGDKNYFNTQKINYKNRQKKNKNFLVKKSQIKEINNEILNEEISEQKNNVNKKPSQQKKQGGSYSKKVQFSFRDEQLQSDQNFLYTTDNQK
ncbi:Insulin-like growth factor binding protein, N-terminal [Pseudocohnilembus persalinus]|uniref:Insulin-like growth factor binding protein, N-terminal n=1 Tax=Pseudocohnilembus persalinus TaxID=266149 RepID=A0A0V0QV41_PSEPJ|nr:Insulin-like growth factor binding protein, N-terminal [Pseudocohnilembus persalinus]|eukprot:KRX06175.1 Insulin-like growth factor binding protein, N-terminal [Pseudocohnilembus persalinus]